MSYGEKESKVEKQNIKPLLNLHDSNLKISKWLFTKKKFKHLIVIGHPDHKSFCYNGIYKTIVRQMRKHKENYKVIDLYEDKLHNDRNDLIKEYQDLITWSTHIYFISPVWWFRLTPKMETFFDEVLTPGFAYKFVNFTKLYMYPKPFLHDKRVRTYITHGSPIHRSYTISELG